MNNKLTTGYSSQVLSIEKWVNWKIVLKPNATAGEKSKALIAVDKYILDFLYKQDEAAILLSTTILHIFNPPKLPKSNLIFVVNLGLSEAQSTGPGTIKPPPPPPIMKILPPFINNIRNLNNAKSRSNR